MKNIKPRQKTSIRKQKKITPPHTKKQQKITRPAATAAKTSNLSKVSFKNPVYSKHIIPGSWKINGLIFILLVFATVCFYYGDLHIGFFDLDDAGYVTDNPFIRSFSAKNLL